MDTHKARMAIEFISGLGMPPPAFVALAADLGCQHIGLALEPIVINRQAYSQWSLRSDARLRKEMSAVLRDRGVSISLGEGFIARANADLRDAAGDLDLLRELGARRVNMISIEADRARAFDQCAVFAELATARGMDAVLEFLPGPAIGNLESAVAAIEHVGKPNFRVLIDAMHFFRSGSTVTELAALAPELIGYVQLCDVPLISTYDNYGQEASCARLPPGNGELPLLDLLIALPREVIVGLELPMLAEAQGGLSPQQRLKGAVDSTEALLRKVTTEKR